MIIPEKQMRVAGMARFVVVAQTIAYADTEEQAEELAEELETAGLSCTIFENEDEPKRFTRNPSWYEKLLTDVTRDFHGSC